uniref:Sec39 domain-containing protein n=1 Tax=Leersia perrieri TaxID=77586 RepID=A0A0D9XY14_9ORYZ
MGLARGGGKPRGDGVGPLRGSIYKSKGHRVLRWCRRRCRREESGRVSPGRQIDRSGLIHLSRTKRGTRRLWGEAALHFVAGGVWDGEQSGGGAARRPAARRAASPGVRPVKSTEKRAWLDPARRGQYVPEIERVRYSPEQHGDGGKVAEVEEEGVVVGVPKGFWPWEWLEREEEMMPSLISGLGIGYDKVDHRPSNFAGKILKIFGMVPGSSSCAVNSEDLQRPATRAATATAAAAAEMAGEDDALYEIRRLASGSNEIPPREGESTGTSGGAGGVLSYLSLQDNDRMAFFTNGAWLEAQGILGVVDDLSTLHLIKENGEALSRRTSNQLNLSYPIVDIVVHDGSSSDRPGFYIFTSDGMVHKFDCTHDHEANLQKVSILIQDVVSTKTPELPHSLSCVDYDQDHSLLVLVGNPNALSSSNGSSGSLYVLHFNGNLEFSLLFPSLQFEGTFFAPKDQTTFVSSGKQNLTSEQAYCYIGFEWFSAVEYSKFHLTPLVETAVALAESGKIGALNLLFKRHPYTISSDILRILSAILETVSVQSYSQLLPGKSPPSIVILRDGDWVECKQMASYIGTCPDLLDKSAEIKTEILLKHSAGFSWPSIVELCDWYRNRARDIDCLSGQLENCLAMIELGCQKGIVELELFFDDIKCLYQVVYSDELSEIIMNLATWEDLPNYEKFKIILKGAKEGTVVQRLEEKAIPFVKKRLHLISLSNEEKQGESYLIIWLKEVASKSELSICLDVFENGCGESPICGLFKDIAVMVETAVHCIYLCSATNQWNTMSSILSKLHHKIKREKSLLASEEDCNFKDAKQALGSSVVSFDDMQLDYQLDDIESLDMLEKKLKVAEGHVEVGRLFAYYQVPKPVHFFLSAHLDEKNIKQIIRLLLSKFGRRQPVRSDMWSDLKHIQEKAFPFLDSEFMLAEFIRGLLKAGKFSLVRNYLGGTSAVSLSTEKAENLVVQAAREYFFSASTLSCNEIWKARECLNLLPNSMSVQAETNVIHALTVRLPYLGVTILPVQFRQLSNDEKHDDKKQSLKIDLPIRRYQFSTKVKATNCIIHWLAVNGFSPNDDLVMSLAKSAIEPPVDEEDYVLGCSILLNLMDPFNGVKIIEDELKKRECFQEISSIMNVGMTYCSLNSLKKECSTPEQRRNLLLEKFHEKFTSIDSDELDQIDEANATFWREWKANSAKGVIDMMYSDVYPEIDGYNKQRLSYLYDILSACHSYLKRTSEIELTYPEHVHTHKFEPFQYYKVLAEECKKVSFIDGLNYKYIAGLDNLNFEHFNEELCKNIHASTVSALADMVQALVSMYVDVLAKGLISRQEGRTEARSNSINCEKLQAVLSAIELNYDSCKEYIQGVQPNNVTIDVIHLVFSAFGFVHRITAFEKAAGFQALIQYTDAPTALEAKNSSDGRSIPRRHGTIVSIMIYSWEIGS